MIAVTGKKEEGTIMVKTSLKIGHGQVKFIQLYQLTFRVTEQNSPVIVVVVSFTKGYFIKLFKTS